MPNARLAKCLSGPLLFVSVNAAMPAQFPSAGSAPKPEEYAVSGRATDSVTGAPVRKATIRLSSVALTSSSPKSPGLVAVRLTTISDQDGKFRFEHLQLGEYRLSGERSGYVATEYGAKTSWELGRILVLGPESHSAEVAVELVPQASIDGKVTDADGTPASAVMVHAVAQTWARGKMRYAVRASASTNDLGEYRLSGLPPGQYYISATPRDSLIPAVTYSEGTAAHGGQEARIVRTFFPRAADFGTALPLKVQAGQDATGTDIRLRIAATYHVRGKITGDLSPYTA